jgi:hypothetical protein
MVAPVKKTIQITEGQAAFLDRKKKEIKRQAILGGLEHHVTDSKIIQGLIEVWMAWDVKERENHPYKNDGRKAEPKGSAKQ